MKILVMVLTALSLCFTPAVISFGADGTGADNPALPFPQIPRISKEEVKSMLGNPDVVVLDCRPEEQWRFSEQKIPGAIHEDPMNVPSWAEKYTKEKTVLIY